MATLLSWLATYLLHSTLLLGGALLVARAVRGPAVREVLWKGALLGGLLTATLHGILDPHLGVPRFDLPLTRSAAPATIALQLRGETPAGGEVGGIDAGAPTGPGDGSDRARSTSGRSFTEAPSPTRWPGLLAASWALGALVLLTSFAHERRRMIRLFASRRPVRDRGPRETLARLLTRAGSKRRVRLTTCPGIDSPVALGASEICLPERAGRDLTPGELEALMAHELAHLERRDSVWLTAMHVLERVLFHQPLNRVVRRRLQSDVEVLCDDSAARRLGEPADLARCLARVAGWMEGSPAPALATGMAHSPSQLVARVERLLAPRSEPRQGASALAALGVGLVLAAVGFGGPGVAAPPVPAIQDTPESARLLRVVASMRADAEPPVVSYRVGGFETTDLERLGRHLALLHTRYPRAGIAVATSGAAGPSLALVDEIFEHFDAILVEGEGPEHDALRAQVVRRRPVRVSLRVLESGRRLDPETGRLWSGEGRWTYDGTRSIEYAIGARNVRLLSEADELLRDLHARRPDAKVRVDAGPGTVYGDVVAVVKAVVGAGFTEIDFVGAYRDSAVSSSLEPEEEEIFEEVDTDEPIAESEPELVEVEGGEADSRVPLEQHPDDWDPILNVDYAGRMVVREPEDSQEPITLELDADGRIRVESELLHDSLAPEASWNGLRAWLAAAAAGMKQVPARGGPEGLVLPDETLLIRADSKTDFLHVQEVMELCARRGIQIWKIELAAPNAAVGPVPVWLPVDPGLGGDGRAPLTLIVRALDAAGDDGRLEYSIGPWKTTRLEALRSALARHRLRRSDLSLVIDPRGGATVLEVLRLLQMVRGEGYGPISFVGARPAGDR